MIELPFLVPLEFLFKNKTNIILNSEWIAAKEADLLVMYKNMSLEDGFCNNYKELARRMQDAGWEQNNNQCCQKVSTIVYF